MKARKDVKKRKRLNQYEQKQVLKMYCVGVGSMPKKELYNKIALSFGCGWQSVYNCVRREMNNRKYKIVFE